jgi:hypothetical protein
MPKRFDVIGINNLNKNSSGFLTYDLVAAQTGVFPYLDPETGDIVHELKHPDDLLTEEVLAQLKNLPVTDDHPWELVNPDNSKELVKGMTSDTARIVGEKLTGRATVFDSGLIGKVLNGNKKECSLGFECEIVEESGTYQGQKYDRRQTNFNLNHLAMVEKGRCGPDCSARLDSKDYAYQVRKDSDILNDKSKKKQNKRSDQKLKTIKLDGKEFEVAEEVASRIDTLKSENEELTKNVGQLEGKLDGKDDQVSNLQKKVDELEGNQLSDKKIDEAVSERLELLKKADKFLDEDYEVEGKSDKEIKIDCIKAVNEKFDGEDRPDEYIEARFDVLSEMLDEGQGSYGDKNLKFKKKDSSSRSDAIEKKRQKRLNMRGDE